MTNYIARGRQVVLPLVNKSGGAVAEGDVVIVSSGTAAAFTTTTSAALNTDVIGVALATIAGDAIGLVCIQGYVPKVTLSGAASLGDTIATHSVAKQAAPSATRGSGSFGQVLGTGTTPAAILWGAPDGVTAGGVASDSLWDAKGDLAVGTGANTAGKLSVGTNGFIIMAASGETTGLKYVEHTRQFMYTVSGTLTAAAGALRLLNRLGGLTITGVYLIVATAPTGADLVVDVHKNGTTIFTDQGNRPTIAASATTGNSTTIDVTALADDDYLTVDVDVIGSTIAGADLTVVIKVKA